MKPFKGWYFLLFAITCVFGVLLLNEWVAVSAPVAGYFPADAQFIITSSDFGYFWTLLYLSDAGLALRHEVPLPLKDWELVVRHETGIRPTPIRWRVWLGRNLVASKSPEGFGICVYPGVLLRALELGRRLATSLSLDSTDSVDMFGNYYYAWHNGYLIVSRSKSFVLAVQRGNEISKKGLPDRTAIEIRYTGEPAWNVTLYAKNGLPYQGVVQARLVPATGPLTLVHACPERPLLSVNTSCWANLQFLRDVGKILIFKDDWRSLLGETWCHLLGKWQLGQIQPNWDVGFTELAFFVPSVDITDGVPVPNMALVLRSPRRVFGEHPLKSLVSDGNVLPMEWEGSPGVIAPLFGDRLALCLGQFDRDWYVASSEKTMARLVGNLKGNTPLETDLLVELYYEQLGTLLQSVMEAWADAQFIPGKSAEELRADLTPWLAGMKRLGRFRLSAKARGSETAIDGFLAECSIAD